jgi:dCTP deaminase
MSVYGKTEILSALAAKSFQQRLFIVPLLHKTQIGNASIDVRLGHEFVTVKRGNVGSLDPAKHDSKPERYRTHHHLNRKEPFYLHPNEMALAATLEYVRLPNTISAYVTSRSKWGRLGLVIATATAVHPGWTGTITLELVNHGNVPLVLHPGETIAQLLLYLAKGAPPYSGMLSKKTSTLPTDARTDWQSDMDFWARR